MHLTGSLAVWDSVPTATGTAFQMLQLLVHREVGEIEKLAKSPRECALIKPRVSQQEIRAEPRQQEQMHP